MIIFKACRPTGFHILKGYFNAFQFYSDYVLTYFLQLHAETGPAENMERAQDQTDVLVSVGSAWLTAAARVRKLIIRS